MCQEERDGACYPGAPSDGPADILGKFTVWLLDS